jgi:hypothetical protein
VLAKVSDLHAGGQLRQKKQNPSLHRGGREIKAVSGLKLFKRLFAD